MKTSTSSLSFPFACGSPSFALISVLALVSLAALTATAFLASARLERTATRPLGEKVRLEMALNIGFNCVKEIINDSVGSSYDTVTTYWRTNLADDIGYLLCGYPRNISGGSATPQMYWFATFSTAKMTELATNAPPTAVMTTRATVDNQSTFSNTISTFMAGITNFGANGSTNIELIGHTSANPRLSPPVGWMTIKQPVRTTPGKTNTTPTPVMRIAFFTEDLSGLIDAERMCGSTTRNTGTNPTEISMANIGPTPGVTFGTSSITRATYLSPFLLASNGGIATTNLRYFATGLRSWTNAIERIPRAIAIATGKTYAGAGVKDGAKVLIDSKSTVPIIAVALTTNLPDFGARGGAMSSTAYISNIAANIVDYVDSDSIANVDTANPPTWRGVEAIAWPNEVYMRFNLASRTTKGSSYEFKLGVKHYIEVWNLGSEPLTVNGADYSISNNLNIPLKCTNWNGNLKSADSATPPASEACTNPYFTLPPNSYGVISAATRTFNILVPTNLAPGTTTPMLTINPSTTVNKYTISYSNKIIDATPGGRWLGFSTNMKVGDFHFITTAVNFGTTANGSTYNLAGGDPRGGLFIQQPMMDMPYNQTTPGGRNSHASSSGGARIVDPKVNWVDCGHSLGNSGADIATSPTSAAANNSIAQGLVKQGNTNHWVQKINNSGTLTNVMELGNIFDPIQWGDPKNPFYPLDTAAWMGLSNSATPFNGACGRNTLRIGRPEHPLFAFTNLGTATDLPIPNMGQSAAALLDIFCATTNGIDDGGRINLNTAPGAVLAALAGGITLKADSAKAGTEVNATMVTAFTNGVMKFRQAYPFYSTSQLPFISTNYGSANWTNTWQASTVFSTNTGCGLKGITEINDQGMEEWFSKIYGLSSVQSRNFRIYVYAQMVNSNNIPYGRVMRKYYHLYAEQTAEAPATPYNNAGYSMVPERESEY